MRKKDKPLFESKEYGIGGHNKIELRLLEDGEPRLWIRDGETNAAICLDKADATALAKSLAKASKGAPEEVQCYDFTKPIKKRTKRTKVTKGTKRDKIAEMVDGIKDIDVIKAEAIAEVM